VPPPRELRERAIISFRSPADETNISDEELRMRRFFGD
jgi:hypothetical protein